MTVIYEMMMNYIYIPFPRERDPFTMDYIPFGASRRMADTTYRVQHVGGKWRVQVFWEGLTQDERGALWDQYGGAIATPVAVQFPNGEMYTMMTGLGTWSENQFYSIGDNAWYYNISFVIEEV